MFRHFEFLKLVFFHSITAFGGPQAHLGMMFNTFVKRTPYITKEELLEYNAFCQLLPGASSSQVLMLIGYKRGGVLLALITFLIWMLPACTIMGVLSFVMFYFNNQHFHTEILKFIPAMAVGFLLYGTVTVFKISIKNLITWIIMLVSGILTFILFKSPWIFPVLIVLGGVCTNFSTKRIVQKDIPKHKKINWNNLWLFTIILGLALVLGGQARKNNWEYKKPVVLFENMYRMGSYVFGGGQVLMPVLYEQYCIRPEVVKEKNKDNDPIVIAKDDMYAGMGLVRAMPGPVFSIAAFTGGLALSEEGFFWQIMGIIIASISIFLPSILLVLFFFPIWNNIKKYAVIYRSLEGINAAVMGIMFASVFYMLRDIPLLNFDVESFLNLAFILVTVLLSLFTKLRPPFIVVILLAISYFL